MYHGFTSRIDIWTVVEVYTTQETSNVMKYVRSGHVKYNGKFKSKKLYISSYTEMSKKFDV